MTMMCTAGCDHISPAEFVNWLGLATPGQGIVYATGFLAAAVHKAEVEKDPNAPEIKAVRKAAWKAHEAGSACLVQRRLGDMRYEYHAIRR
jgi:hypothetical protein